MKKKIIAVTALALVMAMCGVLFSSCKKNTDEAVPVSSTPLTKGRIENVITTMCTVSSSDITEVASSVNAPISEVLVQVGDTVTQGQVLVRLDSSSLKSDLQLKQKALTAAQEAYDAAVTAAQTTLNRAEADYSKIYDAQNTALAALDAKKAELATIDANNAVASTDATVKQKQDVVLESEMHYNMVIAGETVTNPVTNQPYTVEEVSAIVTAARADFEAAKATAFAAAYATCLARVAEAHPTEITPLQEAYTSACKSATDASVTASRSIADAKTALETTKSNTTSVDSAKRDVTEAQKILEKCEITAPKSGTITASKAALNAIPASADSLFTISGNGSFKVTGLLNEYDSTRVAVGSLCEITTNATEDTVMNGKLTLVSPQAADSSGNFSVTADISSPDDSLRSGMTGRLRIILERADDAFYVASDSIGTDANGNSVIYVISDDLASASSTPDDMASQATAITVTTGITTDYYTQITGSGLEEGMNVLDTPLS